MTIQRSRTRPSLSVLVVVWGSCAVASIGLFGGWWLTQAMVDIDGVVCGGAANQWIYGIFDAESKFDDPVDQIACSSEGFKFTLFGAGIWAVTVGVWWLALRLVKPTPKEDDLGDPMLGATKRNEHVNCFWL
ncbi:hypothetical protein [Timonella sp. A28]|uniref:hypothetical protein n=1 Tax=Timonella sp. A28 TaxID=3442640 RepID=UPI003EBC63BF